MAQVLSTTTLIDLLRANKCSDFVAAVDNHFKIKENSRDAVSSMKVIKTVAFHFYDNDIQNDFKESIVRIAFQCADILSEVKDGSSINWKDAFVSLLRIISKLEKDGDLLLMVDPCKSLLRIVQQVDNISSIQNVCHNAYVQLWNFILGYESRLTSSLDLSAFISIAFTAFLIQLSIPGNEKFSFPKIVHKVKGVTSICLLKLKEFHEPKIEKDLSRNLLAVLSHATTADSEASQVFELWTFCLGLTFKLECGRNVLEDFLALSSQLSCLNLQPESVSIVRDILLLLHNVGDRHADLRENSDLTSLEAWPLMPANVVNWLITLSNEKLQPLLSSSEWKEGNWTALTVVTKSLPNLIWKSSDSEKSLMGSIRLLNLLESALLSQLTTKHSSEALKLLRNLFSCHTRLLDLANNNADESNSNLVKEVLSRLVYYLHSTGVSLYDSDKPSMAEEFLLAACRHTVRLHQLDPSHSKENRYRFQLLADLKRKQNKYLDSLMCQAYSFCWLLLSSLSSAEIYTKLQDAGRLWISVKVDWLKNAAKEGDSESLIESIHSVVISNIVKAKLPSTFKNNLLDLGPVPELASSEVIKLIIHEINWYRSGYPEGVGLTKSLLVATDCVLDWSKSGKFSKSLSSAMALLEQSRISWFHEDFTLGLQCASKAYELLDSINSDDKKIVGIYLGVSLFWKYSCDAGILQKQIKEKIAMDKSKQVSEGRVENERLEKGNEDIYTDQGTPTYQGLELEVEKKLLAYLDSAVHLWDNALSDHDLDITSETPWYSWKYFLDILLSVCWHYEVRGYSSVRAWKLLLDASLRNNEIDHYFSAAIHMLKTDYEEFGKQHLPKIQDLLNNSSEWKLDFSKTLEFSLCLSEINLNLGMVGQCRDSLSMVLEHRSVNLNLLKSRIVMAEAKFLASKLRFRPGEWVKANGQGSCNLDCLGPIELAIDAWKNLFLSISWIKEDLTIECRRKSSLLWQLPRLSELFYKISDHIITLFGHISSPRDSKGYANELLNACQTDCLPLRTCAALIHRTKAQVMCDDEAQAQVQLNGIRSILSDLFDGDRVEKTAGRIMNESGGTTEEDGVRLPGDVDSRSASPVLYQGRNSPLGALPTFIKDHSSTDSSHAICDCFQCNAPQLHLILLEYYNLQGMVSMLNGQNNTACSIFNFINRELIPKLSKKYESAVKQQGMNMTAAVLSFQKTTLDILINQCEYYAWKGKTMDAKALLDKQAKILSKYPELCDVAPTLATKHLELLTSLPKLIIEEERENNVEQTMVALDCLSLTPAASAGSLTPVLSHKNSSASVSKAPSKRILPSIGVGNPNKIAKDIEKMDLFDESEDEAEPITANHKKKAQPSNTCLSSIGNVLNMDYDSDTKPSGDDKIPLRTPKPRIKLSVCSPVSKPSGRKPRQEVPPFSGRLLSGSVRKDDIGHRTDDADPAAATGYTIYEDKQDLSKTPVIKAKSQQYSKSTVKKKPSSSESSSQLRTRSTRKVEPPKEESADVSSSRRSTRNRVSKRL